MPRRPPYAPHMDTPYTQPPPHMVERHHTMRHQHPDFYARNSEVAHRDETIRLSFRDGTQHLHVYMPKAHARTLARTLTRTLPEDQP